MTDKRRDVGETVPERVDREGKVEEKVAKRVRGKVRSELVLMAALLIALTGLGWWQTGRFASDLRDAAVDGCQRQNEVRAAVVKLLRADIEADAAIPPSFFPSIPLADFKRLIEEGAARSRESIRDLAPTDCEAKYP